MSFFGVVRFIGCVLLAGLAYLATSFNLSHLADDLQDKKLIVFWSAAGAFVAACFLLFAFGGIDNIYAFFEARLETPYGGAEMAGEVGLWLTFCLIGLPVLAFFGYDCQDALKHRDCVAERRHERLLREWERNHR